MANQEFRDARRHRERPLAVGQAVEIRRGLLRGSSGLLVRLGRDGICLIKLDGMGSGILLSIASASVRQNRTPLAVIAPDAGAEPTCGPQP
jgi:hypothetical protein